MIKGFLSAIIGLAIATIGIDGVSGLQRFTFGRPELLDGIQPILIMVGVFALSELLFQASLPDWEKTARATRIVLPDLKMWRRISRPTAIGTGMGAVEGAMPGAGATVASFMAYNEAKRWSRHPEEFGKGSPEGVAAPEAANNAVTATALVPTLTFGIPGSGSMAVLLGGLILHGIQPGPLLLETDPDLVYGLFGGLFVANLSQLVLGFIMLTPCIWLVNQPKPFLMAGILALIVSGVYSVDHTAFDIGIMIAAGALGYFLRICGFPALPLVLGLVLGGMIERNYRRAVELSYGDHWIFVQDPIAATLLGIAVLLVSGSIISNIRKSRAARASKDPAAA
jgi:putative tricarboxylic transport membrane protein